MINMITVSVKRLISAIEEAESFKMPDMSAGADYIYNNIYGRLSRNIGIRMSEIDFDRFELEDVNAVRDIYSNVLEANERGADTVTRALRGIPPAAVCAFV